MRLDDGCGHGSGGGRLGEVAASGIGCGGLWSGRERLRLLRGAGAVSPWRTAVLVRVAARVPDRRAGWSLHCSELGHKKHFAPCHASTVAATGQAQPAGQTIVSPTGQSLCGDPGCTIAGPSFAPGQPLIAGSAAGRDAAAAAERGSVILARRAEAWAMAVRFALRVLRRLRPLQERLRARRDGLWTLRRQGLCECLQPAGRRLMERSII